MDSFVNKDHLTALAAFQRNYITNQPQGDRFYDYFVVHLNRVWDYLDPVAANAGVTSMIDFVTGCYLELMTEEMKISPAAGCYPYFIRQKTGVADFYAWAIFPVAQFPDIKAYVQAIPAITRFISESSLIIKVEPARV